MKVSDLFEVKYGVNLELNALKKVTSGGINFVSRTSKNNGVSAKVEKISDVNPLPAGLITVAASGSVMESFLQEFPFYSGRDVYYLKSKKNLKETELIYYCLCLKRNRFKYSYGRQANRTLKDIELPTSIPKWVYDFDMTKYEGLDKSFSKINGLALSKKKWAWFKYSDVFQIERGFYNKRPEKIGRLNFVSASAFNNGVTDKVAKDVIEKSYEGNCVTVVNNGQSTTCAFYQKNDFTCSHDVNILRIKSGGMNPFIAMFLAPLIRREKYRFNYGRKWRFQRMQKTLIKLPVNKHNKPDWNFMETYVKSLKYSLSIAN